MRERFDISKGAIVRFHNSYDGKAATPLNISNLDEIRNIDMNKYALPMHVLFYTKDYMFAVTLKLHERMNNFDGDAYDDYVGPYISFTAKREMIREYDTEKFSNFISSDKFLPNSSSSDNISKALDLTLEVVVGVNRGINKYASLLKQRFEENSIYHTVSVNQNITKRGITFMIYFSIHGEKRFFIMMEVDSTRSFIRIIDEKNRSNNREIKNPSLVELDEVLSFIKEGNGKSIDNYLSKSWSKHL